VIAGGKRAWRTLLPQVLLSFLLACYASQGPTASRLVCFVARSAVFTLMTCFDMHHDACFMGVSEGLANKLHSKGDFERFKSKRVNNQLFIYENNFNIIQIYQKALVESNFQNEARL
jgi:hypothetical protein